MTIALLLLNPFAWSYKTILMPGVTLVRSTWLSLACGRHTRHAPMLTQSDFRVSEVRGIGALSLKDIFEKSLSRRASQYRVDPIW